MTTRPTKVPGIPKPPASLPPEVKQYLETLAEAVEIRLGRRGDARDRAVTLRELIDSGLAKDLRGTPFDPNRVNAGNIGFTSPVVGVSLAKPPAVIGFRAEAAYSQINIFWDYAVYNNHSHTEVWSHSSDVLGDATLAGINAGRGFTDPIGGGATQYYWARHVSVAGIYGDFSSSTGAAATTATDPAHILAELANSISVSQLTTSLANQIDGSASTVNGLTARLDSAGGAGVTVEQAYSAAASSINGLEAQYSVKIDNNGHVSGFGLNSVAVDGVPESAFVIRADKFAIVDPASTANDLTNTPSADAVPFGVTNGVVYIKSAAIEDASITAAKIGSVNANSITTGILNVSTLIEANAIQASQLNLVGTGTLIDLKSSASGARMEIKADSIKVFDSSGQVRVKLGAL